MNEDEKKIVLERLLRMPSNMRLMVGGEGKFDKTELMEEVKNETELGELIVQIYMNGLKSFKAVV